jgi:hypothetical protein
MAGPREAKERAADQLEILVGRCALKDADYGQVDAIILTLSTFSVGALAADAAGG